MIGSFPAGLMVSVSGFRGVVGDVLTPELMTTLAAGFGAFLWRDRDAGADESRPPTVLLGRDSRTSGRMIEAAATAGLVSAGVHVVHLGIVPTPTLLFAIRHHRADGALGITASHNPAPWNAFKFAGSDGTFLDADRMARFQQALLTGQIPRVPWDRLGTLSQDRDAIQRHIDAILGLPFLEVDRIRARRFRIALDCVHGAGGNIAPALLEALGCEVLGMGLEPDGHFPRDPEPTAANLAPLGAWIRETGADFGMAVDPDVDRLSLVGRDGQPLGEDLTLALCAQPVLDRTPGPVVTNLSTSRVLEDVAAGYGVPCVRAPVGEINVARRMAAEHAVIGGEGNGGVILPALQYTRDAPVGMALLLQHLVDRSQTLEERVAALPSYGIVKEKLAGVSRETVVAGYASLEAAFGAPEVDREDGLRLSWPDARSWIHLRPSGTEPVVRLIAEAPETRIAQDLIDRARSHLQNPSRIP
jgi:phosphomannomutase